MTRRTPKKAARKAATKRSKRPKTTAKSSVKLSAASPAVGELVPQPHGGALRYGGPNAGGPGRPPNALRALMRGNLDEVIPELHQRWQEKEIDAIQYAEFLAKYAIGPLKGVSDAELDRFASQVAEIVFQECGPEAFERVSARLAAVREKESRA